MQYAVHAVAAAHTESIVLKSLWIRTRAHFWWIENFWHVRILVDGLGMVILCFSGCLQLSNAMQLQSHDQTQAIKPADWSVWSHDHFCKLQAARYGPLVH